MNGRSDKKAFALCGRIRPLDTLFPADTAKTQQRFIFFRLAAAADAAGAVSLLVGLSRLYLGVHYPKDVAVGLALGIAAVFVCPFLWNRFHHEKMLAIMTAACFLPTLLLGQRDLYKAFGLLAGFWAGMMFERRFVGFSNQVSKGKKGLRLLLGLPLLGGVQFLLKLLFPPLLWLDAARYALLVFVALGLYPMIFHGAGF